jgi:hypothetical protein
LVNRTLSRGQGKTVLESGCWETHRRDSDIAASRMRRARGGHVQGRGDLCSARGGTRRI